MHGRAHSSVWSWQDAKNRLSEMVRAAQWAPQTITRHGKRVAVLLDAQTFDSLNKPAGQDPAQKKWKNFVEALLDIPQAPEDEDEDIFRGIPFRKKSDLEL